MRALKSEFARRVLSNPADAAELRRVVDQLGRSDKPVDFQVRPLDEKGRPGARVKLRARVVGLRGI